MIFSDNFSNADFTTSLGVKAPVVSTLKINVSGTVFIVTNGSSSAFFLIASLEERAKRRFEQLKEIGLEVNMPTLVDNIRKRDKLDTYRDISPAVPAEDALTIDTSDLSAGELKNRVLKIIRT